MYVYEINHPAAEKQLHHQLRMGKFPVKGMETAPCLLRLAIYHFYIAEKKKLLSFLWSMVERCAPSNPKQVVLLNTVVESNSFHSRAFPFVIFHYKRHEHTSNG